MFHGAQSQRRRSSELLGQAIAEEVIRNVITGPSMHEMSDTHGKSRRPEPEEGWRTRLESPDYAATWARSREARRPT